MARRFARTLVPSLADLAFICTFFLVLWLGQFISNRDGDLGWHIAIGRVILSTGSVPTHDVFSHTMPGKAFVPHEWLAELLFAGIYQIGGFDGIALLTAGVIALSFGILTAVMLRRGLHPWVVLPLVMLGVLTSIAHWATRPHIFTLLFTLLWATALEEHRRGKIGLRGLLALLPLMLIWVNVHGAFIIGHALTATYIAGAALMWFISGAEARRLHWRQGWQLLVLLGLSLPLMGLNPSGFGLMANNAGFFQQDALLKLTPEWQSPDFHNLLFYPFMLMLVLALAVSVRREITPLLLLVSWAAFSLYSFRNLMQFVVICLPLLGDSLQAQLGLCAEALRRRSDWPSGLRQLAARFQRSGAQMQATALQVTGGAASLLAVLVAAGLLYNGVRLDLWHKGYGFSEKNFPIAAVQQITPFPPGQRVFNDAVWGGYLSFCCWPAVPTFFDGRIDFYGAAYMRDYQRVQDAEPGWQDVLDRYKIDWVMVFPDRPLVPWLDRDPAWRRIYSDATAVVFVRRAASP